MATKPVKAPAKAEAKTEAKKPAAPKAAAKPAAAKKEAAPKAAAPAKKQTAGLTKPVTPSSDLAAIVGAAPLPRTQVISKIWEYIHAHKLQNPENKREILADAKLKVIFKKDKVTMFEMNKLLSPHMK
jgi:upstream activation factor subunit UAF30